jgi:2-desacetyl-2-hydroxyethyl bacteriochlorophyllide A dehydrogenase
MNAMPLARIHAPNDVRIDQVARPCAGPDDVLIEVRRCGICGSDLSYVKIGGIPGAAMPFALGHEFSGVVVETGQHVRHLQVGDRVLVNPETGRNGIGSNGLKGAFSPYIVFTNAAQHPEGVLKLPPELDFDLGALVEPLSVGMHGANQGKVTAGDKVVVFGAGPVGLAAAIAAKYFKAENVIVADLSEKRLEVARQLGLTTFKADSGNLKDFLMDQHGVVTNDPRLGEQPGTDVFIEVTGAGPVFQQICETARKGARIVVVGVHFAPVELNMINLLMRELVITAAMEYPVEFPYVIEMLLSGEVDVRPLISHRFPLSRFDEAFAQARRQNEAVKVLVDCQS